MISLNRIKNQLSVGFLKDVIILMSGTAIAQGMAFAASPILSRLYEPTAFGVFGLFTTFCGIITVVAGMKYELSILLPKKTEDAVNLLGLTFLIVLTVSTLLFILVFFCRFGIADILGSPDLAPLLWWAPISVLFTGLYNTFSYWITRRKEFKKLSISRVIKTTSREGTQLGLGYSANLQSLGLVSGFVIGEILTASTLIYQSLRSDYNLIRDNLSFKYIKILAYDHRDFLKYNAPQTFLNAVSQNVPAILLAFFFNPAIVGFYWFTRRILFTPNELIGKSIRQVFYQRVNELVNEGKSPRSFYLKSTIGLAGVGIVPLILIILFGESVFGWVFGSEWIEAGRYAQWLVLWWFSGFINPPSIMMIPILNLHKSLLIYEIFHGIFRVIAICIGGMLGNAILAIAIFSIVGLLGNLSLVSYISIKINDKP